MGNKFTDNTPKCKEKTVINCNEKRTNDAGLTPLFFINRKPIFETSKFSCGSPIFVIEEQQSPVSLYLYVSVVDIDNVYTDTKNTYFRDQKIKIFYSRNILE